MTKSIELDHLAIVATRLEDGVAYVEDALGVSLSPGGEHTLMGTHNRLLGLADGIYLEVIAINPEAPNPPHARWFDLDALAGPPRLGNWVARCADISATLAQAPPGAGKAAALSRGRLNWTMAISENGKLPFEGTFPGLLQWHGAAHPCEGLPASGCTLTELELQHPKANALKHLLDGCGLADTRISFVQAPVQKLTAQVQTPHGLRVLA